MLKFAMRHGLVRLIGGRAIPLMWAWDVAVLANKARRIPLVDRTLRRGAGAAVRGAGSVVASPRWATRPGRRGILERRAAHRRSPHDSGPEA
jgi:hypothetical protein